MALDNAIMDKSFAFAVRIVRLCRYLKDKRREFTLSKQVLRSGTSIGANVREGKYAQSRADFAGKLSIALKEAAETGYWIELLHATDYLDECAFQSLIHDCHELIRLLTSIIKSTKNRN